MFFVENFKDEILLFELRYNEKKGEKGKMPLLRKEQMAILSIP